MSQAYSFTGSQELTGVTDIGALDVSKGINITYDDVVDQPDEITTKAYVDAAIGGAVGSLDMDTIVQGTLFKKITTTEKNGYDTHLLENTQLNDPHNLATQIDTGTINAESASINLCTVNTTLNSSNLQPELGGQLSINGSPIVLNTASNIDVAGAFTTTSKIVTPLVESTGNMSITSATQSVTIGTNNVFNANSLTNDLVATNSITVSGVNSINQVIDGGSGDTDLVFDTSPGASLRGVRMRLRNDRYFRVEDQGLLGLREIFNASFNTGIQCDAIRGLNATAISVAGLDIDGNSITGDGVTDLNIVNGASTYSFTTALGLSAPSFTSPNGSTSTFGHINANSLTIDNGNMEIDTIGGKIRLNTDVNMCIDVQNTNRMLCLQNNSIDQLCVSATGAKVRQNISTIPDGNTPQPLALSTNNVSGQSAPGSITMDVGQSGTPQFEVQESKIVGRVLTEFTDTVSLLSANPNLTVRNDGGASSQINIANNTFLSSLTSVQTAGTLHPSSLTGDSILSNTMGTSNMIFLIGASVPLTISNTGITSSVDLNVPSLNGEIPVNQNNVLDLQLQIDGKAPVDHTHVTADIIGLDTLILQLNDAINNRLSLTGGTMIGDIDMNSNSLSNVALINGQPVGAGSTTKAIGMMRKTNLQTINAGAITTLNTYNITYEDDLANAFTLSSTGITINAEGIYRVTYECSWNLSTAGTFRESWINVTGDGNRYGWLRFGPQPEFLSLVGSSLIILNPGQVISISVAHNSPGTLDIGVDVNPASYMDFSIEKVG